MWILRVSKILKLRKYSLRYAYLKTDHYSVDKSISIGFYTVAVHHMKIAKVST
jgi:hypothetical protein